MVSRNKLTAVLDTNLFISAIIKGGTPYKLLKAWQQDKFSIITSEDIFDEIVEVFKRPEIYQKYDINLEEVEELLEGVKLNAFFVTPLNINDLPIHCRDPKDDKLLSCGVAGKADYLITGDKDLLDLNENPVLKELKIITVREFLNILHL